MFKTEDKVKVVVSLKRREEVLSCPPPNMSLWNMHPKVYLSLDLDDQAICPYCSTVYVVCDE